MRKRSRNKLPIPNTKTIPRVNSRTSKEFTGTKSYLTKTNLKRS